MKCRIGSGRSTWLLTIVVAAMPSALSSQIDSTGSCSTPGLVMAGVFTNGQGLIAGLTGSREGILYLHGTDADPVRDWPFRLECVNGKLQLTSGRVRGATSVTHAVFAVRQEPRACMVLFRGTNLNPEEPMILFAVRPGLLPSDAPVATYSEMDGNSVYLLKGVVATTAPAYASYLPPWR